MSSPKKYTDAEIKAVCAERNCSPARAVEFLESAAWHAAVEAKRPPAPAEPPPAPAE